ncbi:MAG TPA: hypothetical protein PKA63_14525 [Oligoflexia bacterium]|nr:hypothetical protein [Oligoflexia bacterium]HMP49881.1 hypothetical protein [Oligoflexia bacterium]
MFFLDAHAHFYPDYSYSLYFDSLFKNIEKLKEHTKDEEDVLQAAGIILTERNDCSFYRTMLDSNSFPTELKGKYYMKGDVIYSLTNPTLTPVRFYPGRQVSTIERIEVLALLREEPLPENIKLETLISLISESGGIPVINWAPGKWMGERGRIVKETLLNNQQNLLLGITTLLPLNFPFPPLLFLGKKLGINCIGGSDPLPFSGEEKLVGTFGMAFPALDTAPELHALKHLLLRSPYSFIGRRNNFAEVLYRLIRNEFVRRQ